ncbi:MAG: acyltransferase family protein [Clostridiales bacterium]|jgi:fucose 4-O-acetylase-like acetyltransferase|nr:acyltransferase family protein [Clostridiales bacterium]
MRAEEDGGRFVWVDWAKTIGIYLVIAGHLSKRFVFAEPCKVRLECIHDFIYVFHMPLFFFISGFLEKERGFRESVKRAAKSLLLPYVLFFGIFYVFYAFGACLKTPAAALPAALAKPLRRFFTSGGFTSSSYAQTWLAASVWFLPSLFWVKIAHAAALKIRGGRLLYYAASAVLAAVIVPALPKIPFYLSSAVLSFPFFAAGFIARRTGLLNKLKRRGKLLNVVFAAAGFFLVIYGSFENDQVNVYSFIYGRSLPLFYFFGAAGVLATVSLCLLFRRGFRAVRLISGGTLTILAVHGYAMAALTVFMNARVIPGVFAAAASALFVLLLCLPVVIFVRERAPALSGGPNPDYSRSL